MIIPEFHKSNRMVIHIIYYIGLDYYGHRKFNPENG